jgi:plastocyanin domain-containing protein
MTPDKILVLVLSLIGIGFTYWFFLMKRDKEVVVTGDSIDIKVEGGYSPDFISIPKGKTTKLNFMRTDPSTCLEEVVMSDFKIRKYLPINKTVTIEITPKKEGEFPFSCGMHMFHGKLKVTS